MFCVITLSVSKRKEKVKSADKRKEGNETKKIEIKIEKENKFR